MAARGARAAGKVYRVALVHPAAPVAEMSETGNLRFRAFFGELRRLGYVEGRNLIVERYSGEGRTEHYGELAHDVVRLKPDLIFAIGNVLTTHFKSATATIPIVATTSDPVVAGFATSLAHPGSNITGVSVDAGLAIWGKRLALLKETIPALSRVGFLSTRVVWERPQGSAAAAREAAQQLGILLSGALLEGSVGEAEYRRVFAAMAQDRVDALIVLDEPEHFTNLNVIVELAQKARLPAIYSWREPIELGGLMAYAYDPVDLYHQASRQIERVLKGAKPQETPFYQSTKFELILNLKAAKALGLTFPSSLLGSADEVIE